MKYLFLLLSVTALSETCSNNDENIIFEEHFEGQELNVDYWNYELGNGCPDLCGWGNNERQNYTKDNIAVRDGNLVITAHKDQDQYYSGRITTKDKIEFQYGTIEVKAKLPAGKGLWPAIWMLGHDIDDLGWPACGEIDIMEYVGKNPHEIHTTLHTSDSHGDSKNTKITYMESIEEGFHIYKSVWTENYIEFFIDGTSVYQFVPDIKTQAIWPFDKPYFIILNLAIGGNFGGPDVDDSIFPQSFLIDYVKVTKNI